MKLLHFTDLHLSLSPAPETQFHVQPFWRGDAALLFERLERLARQADAILFTGDATHGGGAVEAARFIELLASTAAGKPVFISLGNHDVVNPKWKEHFGVQATPHANFHFQDGLYAVGDAQVLLIHSGYVSAANLVEAEWNAGRFPVPGLRVQQLEQLEMKLSSGGNLPVIAATHCPSHVLPPTASGFADYVGPGMDAYRAALVGLLDRHPRVRAMVAGHVHFNSTQIASNGRVHQSLSSVAEHPCQVRMLELTASKLGSRLVSLADEAELEAANPSA
jgi:3',5'-cyclic AMP phosphodiesterase CpdA